MPTYLFLIVILVCLVFHLSFGISRKKSIMKLDLEIAEKRRLEQMLESNILFAVFIIGICFFISLIHLFILDWHPLLFPMTIMESKITDYFGMFLVKISFICNIVLYFQVSNKFSFELNYLTVEKVLRLESLILFTNVLLSSGVFIYIPNVFSFTTFLYAVCFFCYRKFRS